MSPLWPLGSLTCLSQWFGRYTKTGVADVPLPSRQLSLSKRLLKNVDQSLYKRTACETYVGADVAPLNISVRNRPGGISREKRGVTPSNK